MAGRKHHEIVDSMIHDIGETPDEEEAVAWMRREVHAIVTEIFYIGNTGFQAQLDELLSIRAMAIDMDVQDKLRREFYDPAI